MLSLCRSVRGRRRPRTLLCARVRVRVRVRVGVGVRVRVRVRGGDGDGVGVGVCFVCEMCALFSDALVVCQPLAPSPQSDSVKKSARKAVSRLNIEATLASLQTR